MKRNLVSSVIILLFTATMFAACGDANKGPAELAIKAAEEAVNAAKAEALKFVPDQVTALETALASAKDKLTKGDFKTALTEAQGLVDRAKEVLAAAKAKKDELVKKWTDLIQGLPEMIEAIQSRVDILSQAKELPDNMTAGQLGWTKIGVAALNKDWTKALESFKSGNMADAISIAKSVKKMAVGTMEALGIPVPVGARE